MSNLSHANCIYCHTTVVHIISHRLQWKNNDQEITMEWIRPRLRRAALNSLDWEWEGCFQMVLDWMCVSFMFFMFYPNVRGFLYCKNKVNDIVFWSRVSPKNWCYRGSLSPCSTHPDTEPILLSLPDTKEFLHTAMAFSEILRIRLIIYAKLSFLILLPKIHPLIY
jgi:hypothetical protein